MQYGELMERNYLLEWFDLVVAHLGKDQDELSIAENRKTLLRIETDAALLPVHFSRYVFMEPDEKKIRLLISHYHSSLHCLLEMAALRQKRVGMNAYFARFLSELIDKIQTLQRFLETQYRQYIHPKALVSAQTLSRYLEKVDRKQKVWSESIQEILTRFPDLGKRWNIVASYWNVSGDKISVSQLRYRKLLIKEVLAIARNPGENPLEALDEVLVSINFNSSRYLDLLFNRLAGVLDGLKAEERRSRITAYLHRLQLLAFRTNTALHPNRPSLHEQIEKWLLHESALTPATTHVSAQVLPSREQLKVRCNLSSDQIALLLRAADEARLLESRSMNEVFRSIIPHLSTPRKIDLSFSSVRSKAYVAEERDKEVTIAALQRLILKVKEY